MYLGLKRYLKEKVRERLMAEEERGVDAFGAGDFLPDLEDAAVRRALAARKGGRKEELQSGVEKIRKKKAAASRLSPLHMRSFCVEREKGRYRLSLIAPRKAERVRLELFLAGEQTDVPVKLLAASLSGRARAKLVKFEKNVIELQNVAKGAKLFVDYTMDYRDYCLMEVKYVEDPGAPGAVSAAGEDE